jgi:hypothetical protein
VDHRAKRDPSLIGYPSDWLPDRPAFRLQPSQPLGRFMWSGRDTMPLLNVFRPESPKVGFKYRQHPTL